MLLALRERDMSIVLIGAPRCFRRSPTTLRTSEPARLLCLSSSQATATISNQYSSTYFLVTSRIVPSDSLAGRAPEELLDQSVILTLLVRPPRVTDDRVSRFEIAVDAADELVLRNRAGSDCPDLSLASARAQACSLDHAAPWGDDHARESDFQDSVECRVACFVDRQRGAVLESVAFPVSRDQLAESALPIRG